MAISKKKREKRNKIILSVVTAFIMVSSILGIVSYNNNPGEKYNGFNLQYEQNSKYGNVYKIKYDGKYYYFHFHPANTLVFNLSDDYKNLVRKKKLIFTSDKDADDYVKGAEYMLRKQLEQMGVSIKQGFTDNQGTSVPKYICEDGTEDEPVIYFRMGDKAEMKVDGNCLRVTATTPQELFLEKDRILYDVIGVLDEKK